MTADVVAVWPERRGSWRVRVRCPFCSVLPRPRHWPRGSWGFHVHGIHGPDSPLFPVLGSRSADCGRGEYVLGPLPANFDAIVSEVRG